MAAKGLNEIIEEYKDARGGLIPVLQQAQELYGYLPPEVLKAIAKGLGAPLSRVYGVVTFYAQFYLSPKGRHGIKSCQGTACHVRGAKNVLRELENQLGICAGGTTEDMNFSLETVACVGTCFLAPVMMVDNDYYGDLEPKKIKKILKQYKEQKEEPAESTETAEPATVTA